MNALPDMEGPRCVEVSYESQQFPCRNPPPLQAIALGSDRGAVAPAVHARVRQESAGRAEHDAWFRRQVQLGIDSTNAGNLTPQEEVEAKFATRRAETLRKLGQGGA